MPLIPLGCGVIRWLNGGVAHRVRRHVEAAAQAFVELALGVRAEGACHVQDGRAVHRGGSERGLHVGWAAALPLLCRQPSRSSETSDEQFRPGSKMRGVLAEVSDLMRQDLGCARVRATAGAIPRADRGCASWGQRIPNAPNARYGGRAGRPVTRWPPNAHQPQQHARAAWPPRAVETAPRSPRRVVTARHFAAAGAPRWSAL